MHTECWSGLKWTSLLLEDHMEVSRRKLGSVSILAARESYGFGLVQQAEPVKVWHTIYF